MRVIQVTPRYYPTLGGVEAVVQKISEMLVDRGNEVVVYSVDKRRNLAPVENVNGVIVKRFTALYGDPLYFPETSFSSSLRKENADIIHVHNIHTFPPLIAACIKLRIKGWCCSRIITVMDKRLFVIHFSSYTKKHVYGLLFSKTSLTIANSAYEKRILREDFPSIKNMVLVPEGLDTSEAERVVYILFCLNGFFLWAL